jgi:cyclin H
MKELIEQASQFRNWQFTEEQLREKRELFNETSIKRAQECVKEERDLGGSVQDPKFITAQEQLELARFFETKIADYCKVFKFDHSIQVLRFA